MVVRFPAPDDPWSKHGAVVSLEASGLASRLFGYTLGGGQLGLRIGGEGPRAAWAITTDLLLGRTDEGLTLADLRWGADVQARLGSRVRLGGGIDFGALMIRRATTGAAMSDFVVGPHAVGTVDLGRPGPGTMPYFAARVGDDFLPAQNGAAMLTASLAVGVRL